MVTKEFLDSDRVNFLVWRYLLESNYRETAAKFQKEWHVQQPHRQFDFANHIKSHALVSVINKGLCYHALEREHAKKLMPQDAAAAAEALQVGLFGPLIPQPPHKMEEDEDADGEVDDTEMEVENSRKRQLDSRPQQHLVNGGSPTKRPRLSNGYESTNGADAATDPMELDNHGDNNHAYPSPLEGEQAPTPTPRTDGPEQGTQVDKVQELATETTFLRLMPDDASAAASSNAQDAAATTTATSGAAAASAGGPGAASPSPANGENAPILLRCEWNPKDPSILAAAGTDALARIWTISRSSTMTPAPAPESDGHVHGVHRPYHNLVDDETPKTATVGQLAWNWGGTAIATATDYAVHIWAKDGSHIDKFDVSEPPIIKLRWSPSDAALLAIAPDNSNGNGNGGALITVYHSLTSNTLSYFLPNHDFNNWPLDAAWTSETEFLLTGGDVMLSLRCTDTAILLNKKLESRDDDTFTQVVFDKRSRLAATASDKGVLDLWDENGQRRSITAHSGAITSLQWQPLPADSNPPEDERLIASGGDDCAILIWNAKYPEQKPKSFLTMESPIVAVAFTPDGAFIAGATAGRVLIWKVGEHTMPRASWSRAPHPGWLSPKANSEPEEEDEHCLCWDADGQRLAYGANSRLAVINFSR